MLRGAPSALRPQRSIETACVTSLRRHASINTVGEAPIGATSIGTPAAPAPAKAAAQAARHGSSVARRHEIPTSASPLASSAVPTGPSVSAAGGKPNGT